MVIKYPLELLWKLTYLRSIATRITIQSRTNSILIIFYLKTQPNDILLLLFHSVQVQEIVLVIIYFSIFSYCIVVNSLTTSLSQLSIFLSWVLVAPSFRYKFYTPYFDYQIGRDICIFKRIHIGLDPVLLSLRGGFLSTYVTRIDPL